MTNRDPQFITDSEKIRTLQKEVQQRVAELIELRLAVQESMERISLLSTVHATPGENDRALINIKKEALVTMAKIRGKR